MDGDRPEVGEQLEAAAEREERLLGPDARVRVVPVRSADRAEQDRVGVAGRSHVLVSEGRSVGVDGGPAGEDARATRP